MYEEIKDDIALIELSDVNDRLMLVALYNHFYNLCKRDAQSNDTLLVVRSVFKLLLDALKDSSVKEADSIMRAFLKCLNKSNMLNDYKLKALIEAFESYLDLIVNDSRYVKIIDEYVALSFKEKARYVIQYRDFLFNVDNQIGLSCAQYKGEELRNIIVQGLEEKLPSINLAVYTNLVITEELVINDDVENEKSRIFRRELEKITKDILIGELKRGNLNRSSIKDPKLKKVYSYLTYTEQTICLMAMVYNIAGYDGNDKSRDVEKMKEICQVIGITESDYLIVLINLVTHMNSLKEKLDFSEEEFGGEGSTLKM